MDDNSDDEDGRDDLDVWANSVECEETDEDLNHFLLGEQKSKKAQVKHAMTFFNTYLILCLAYNHQHLIVLDYLHYELCWVYSKALMKFSCAGFVCSILYHLFCFMREIFGNGLLYLLNFHGSHLNTSVLNFSIQFYR